MTMQVDSLYRVDPPESDRPPIVVAREVLSLYRKDFHFTTFDICRLLLCERQWVSDFIMPEVQHLLVTSFFRKYIVDKLKDSMDEHEYNAFVHSFYFFSETSLIAFWKAHAEASQKTRLVDLADYLDPASSSSALLQEKERHDQAPRSRWETEKHLSNMESLLTEQGFSIYVRRNSFDGEWEAVPLPKLPVSSSDTPITTIDRLRRTKGFRNNTAAYKYLFTNGAIRIKLGGKVYWQVPEHSGVWLIPTTM